MAIFGGTEADQEVGGSAGRVAVLDGIPASVALVNQTRRIERATRTFVERMGIDDASPPCERELELIIAGEADHLRAVVDGQEAEAVAVLDGDGMRLAMLTLAVEREDQGTGSRSPLLEESLDDSPAIVWLKDLEGRYLRVNRRYAEQLGVDAEEICGQTDAELTPARSIEGPRLQADDRGGQEPLELEYAIAAFDGRPAFAALRFALRDREGRPTAVCGVAAPRPEASLARAECERLMRIDRWGRLDGLAIRQELLDEWGVTLADGSSGPPLDRDDRIAAAVMERDEALATATRLEEQLATERAALEQAAEAAQARATEMEAELSALRAELDEQLVRAEALELARSTPGGGEPHWSASSQRALSGALIGVSEWQVALELAVGKLGSEGGWDASIAWRPDEQRGSMRCTAMWVADPQGLATFETRTWQQRQDTSAAEFGRARSRMAATCLLELETAEDPLLRAAAAEGIGSALLVPIRDGVETIAMLELLSRSESAPDAEVMVALEAIAAQLGTIAQLLKLADVPRWRVGRL